MERLTAVLYVLSQADPPGCPADRIVALGLYGGEPEGQREQLARDIGHLRRLGWEIDNVGAPGSEAVYRLVAGDNRLRLEFTADERVELYRCARLAGLLDVAHGLRPDVMWPSSLADADLQVEALAADPGLDDALTAIGDRRRLHFRYFGVDREVAPRAAYDRSGAWYLVGREVEGDGLGPDKTFRLDRMADTVIGDPWDDAWPSSPSPGPAQPVLDPLSWVRDEPMEVLVATTVEHRPRVVAMLGSPSAETADGSEVILTVRTTNVTVFLHRLCQLRERVRLLGPEILRDRLRSHLLAVAGEVP